MSPTFRSGPEPLFASSNELGCAGSKALTAFTMWMPPGLPVTFALSEADNGEPLVAVTVPVFVHRPERAASGAGVAPAEVKSQTSP